MKFFTFRWIQGFGSRFQGLIFAADVFLISLRIRSIFCFSDPVGHRPAGFLYQSVIGQQLTLTDGQHVTRHIKMSAKASRLQCAALRALSLPPSTSLSNYFISQKIVVGVYPQVFTNFFFRRFFTWNFAHTSAPDPVPEPRTPDPRTPAPKNIVGICSTGL